MSKKVFVSGCYDIIHGGHVEFFTQAKNHGGPKAKLIVSFASDDVLLKYKDRKSSLPQEHKKRILESLAVVDEVVIGTNVDSDGIDFYDHFINLKPDYLVVTEDDKYEEQKRALCKKVGTEYIILPKTLHYEKISTTEIVNWIKAPKEVPLRVDFAGGWLDVPKYSDKDAYIVNCSISPLVSLKEWSYNIKSGLGGSGAYAILTGVDGVKSELDMGVGWQDPAIIQETGLCVWRSGEKPVLEVKVNPDFLQGKMALFWTGYDHDTPSNVNNKRPFDKIKRASIRAADAVVEKDYNLLCIAIDISFSAQLSEGMAWLPITDGCIARKYCGGGWGGYALYMFDTENNRDKFCERTDVIPIEPFMR